MARKMNSEQVIRYKKKVYNRFNASQIDKVDMRSSDMVQVENWLDFMFKADPNKDVSSEPMLNNCVYVIEQSDNNDDIVNGILTIRFKVLENGRYEFYMYPQNTDGELPNKARLIFHIFDIEYGSKDDPRRGAFTPYGVEEQRLQGYFDIDIIDHNYNHAGITMEEMKQTATNIFQLWISINYFLTNFERDIVVSEYKYTIQNSGGKKKKKKGNTVRISKIYKCHLPDDWVARNEREYHVAEWSRRGHWHKMCVNEDFLEKKAEEMTEEELMRTYRLVGPHPHTPGKIYVEKWFPATTAKRQLPLSSNSSGVEDKKFVI